MDLNPEAIQICQLSLWIKTAARGKRLTSLDHPTREGNSIITDLAVHPKAFGWQAAFPEVLAQIPSLQRHLKPLEEPLRKRQDKGRCSWGQRSCAYWDAFE